MKIKKTTAEKLAKAGIDCLYEAHCMTRRAGYDGLHLYVDGEIEIDTTGGGCTYFQALYWSKILFREYGGATCTPQ